MKCGLADNGWENTSGLDMNSGLTAATGKKITNHSSRKTCVQKLENAGVSWDKIIDITGHRNVLSLNSYEGDDKNQAKELSKLIS